MGGQSVTMTDHEVELAMAVTPEEMDLLWAVADRGFPRRVRAGVSSAAGSRAVHRSAGRRVAASAGPKGPSGRLLPRKRVVTHSVRGKGVYRRAVPHRKVRAVQGRPPQHTSAVASGGCEVRQAGGRWVRCCEVFDGRGRLVERCAALPVRKRARRSRRPIARSGRR